MVLIYAFVARKQTVLAEYTGYSGNFSTVATQVRRRPRRRPRRRREGRRGIE